MIKGVDTMSSGWKKTPNSKPTITITLNEELLKIVEDYQYTNRIPSRSKAINEIIKLGILSIEKEG